MPAQQAAAARIGRKSLTVVANRECGSYRVLEVADPHGPAPQAGQFYMLASADEWGGTRSVQPGRPFLPRAMSAWSSERGRLSFLLEAVGPGTTRLCGLHSDQRLFATGPLGHGFKRPADLGVGVDAQTLLVAGGVGVPPILALERELLAEGELPIVMAGFRSEQFMAAAALFESDVRLAIDEGEVGNAHSGLVTDLLSQSIQDQANPVVYACGPAAMLEAVRAICARREIAAELALEAPMACGFGACFGCVVETKQGYIRLCTDGPVVNASELTSALEKGRPIGAY